MALLVGDALLVGASLSSCGRQRAAGDQQSGTVRVGATWRSVPNIRAGKFLLGVVELRQKVLDDLGVGAESQKRGVFERLTDVEGWPSYACHRQQRSTSDECPPLGGRLGIVRGCKQGFDTAWLAFAWLKPVFCMQNVYSASGSLTINKLALALVLYAP